MTITDSKWFLVNRVLEAPRVNLLCLPYAGGGASTYANWQADLKPGIQLLPVQLPGRENRFSEKAFDNLTALVDELVPLIQPLCSQPWAIFGHSMGALVASELTRQLIARQCSPPQQLFLSGKAPPHLPLREPLLSTLDDELLLVQLAETYGAEVSDDRKELLQLMLGTIRADARLVESGARRDHYALPCPISAIHGTQDASVSKEAMMQWAQYSTEYFDYIDIPGTHFNLLSAQPQIISAINSRL